ncbi:hypothetical protein POM88_005131 [Heracleum sosnowskyi]|uniref:Uncharacterized protein n=1 Tax=Heracleum sosnowskyi TaxID=360622 RepID=A0AAD8NEU2_9APIA|nr:hypothetical protein POM88_005131 [Heracleum sosnowskyi]
MDLDNVLLKLKPAHNFTEDLAKVEAEKDSLFIQYKLSGTLKLAISKMIEEKEVAGMKHEQCLETIYRQRRGSKFQSSETPFHKVFKLELCFDSAFILWRFSRMCMFCFRDDVQDFNY